MKLCEAHEKTFVIHSSDDCPLCRAGKILEDARKEIEKALAALQGLKQEVEKAGNAV